MTLKIILWFMPDGKNFPLLRIVALMFFRSKCQDIG